MKALLLFLIAFPALATEGNFNCNFSRGEIFRNGQRVARTFDPRVLQGSLTLDVDTSASTIYIRDLFSGGYGHSGYANCLDSMQREGFDCFMVFGSPYNRAFEAYVGNQGQRMMVLVSATGTPGGAYQEDQYSCNR